MEGLLAARRQFAVTERAIYLDLANQNSPPETVVAELERFHRAAHREGPDKPAYFARVEDVRQQMATLFHCHPHELAWTKNTSEGLNIAAAGIDYAPGDNVILSQFEHPNNTYPWLALARQGVEVRIVRPPGDVVTADDFIALMDDKTRAVACSAVSYMPGERLDLARLATACRHHGAYLVVDAVQAVGLVDLNPRTVGIDLLATSGHKGLLSPHGVGMLYCRQEISQAIRPAFVARSSMQQLTAIEHDAREYAYSLQPDARRFEYGNLNYSGISALGAALDLILGIGIETIEHHVLELGETLLAGLRRLEHRGVEILTPQDPTQRGPIIGFRCPAVTRVADALQRHSVVFTVRRDAIRFGLGLYNNQDEVEQVLGIITESIS